MGFGGRVWREELCIYIYLICFFVQQKLTQHHTVIICQFLKKKGYHWYFMNLLNNGMCVCVCVCVCVPVLLEKESIAQDTKCVVKLHHSRGAPLTLSSMCVVFYENMQQTTCEFMYAALEGSWIHMCSRCYHISQMSQFALPDF